MAQRIAVQFSSPQAFQTEYARHISGGGVFVPMEEPLEVGTPVQVSVGLPDGAAVELPGVVIFRVPPGVETEAEPGLGVRFSQMPPDERARLEAAGDSSRAASEPPAVTAADLFVCNECGQPYDPGEDIEDERLLVLCPACIA